MGCADAPHTWNCARTGKMRTGKSFILNRLCGARAGFKVGPTTSHCTEGLWIWGVYPASLLLP